MTTSGVNQNKAYDDAIALYATTAGRGSLLLDILHYAREHYCYFSPDCIILAHVVSDDTWHIHLACGVGCLARFFVLAPYRLPYISYDRPLKNKEFTTRYEWDKLKHHVDRLHAQRQVRATGA